MKNFILFVVLFLSGITFAQVGIGTTSPEALLDLNATDKGILIPRVALISKATNDPVFTPSGSDPANGTLVFNTATTTLGDNDDVIPGFYYWDTATLRWVYVGNDPKMASTTWNLLGNAATNPATDFIGTTDNQDVVFRRDNQRAGVLGETNTSFGTTALQSNTIGLHNTAVGTAALQANTGGEWNTAIGEDALLSNTFGVENTASGIWALRQNTTGDYNTATGSVALELNTTGYENTAHGAYALSYNTEGDFNTASGSSALGSNITGIGNTASGAYSLFSNTEGNFNTASGFNASQGNTTGNNNTTNGAGALYTNTTGNNNTASGFDTGRYIADGTTPNTTPNNSIFIGANTRAQADNQTNQIVIGNDAIGNGSNTVTLGDANIIDNYFTGNVRGGAFIKAGGTSNEYLMADGTVSTGTAASWGAITGTLSAQTDLQNALNLKANLASPTFTGTPIAPTATLGTNTTQVATTAFVMANTLNIPHLEFSTTFKTIWNNGSGNIATNTSYGEGALISNTTGNSNTASGVNALQSNTSGGNNTAIGGAALQSNTTGDENTANGVGALQSNQTGPENTAIGFNAGRYITGGSTANTTPNNSIFVGVDTRAQAGSQVNQIVIGNHTTGNGSNTVTIGNSSISNNYFTGNIRGGAFIKTGATATNILLANGTDIAQPTISSLGGITASSTNTLTNKSISGSDNTLTNIPQTAVTNLTSDLLGKQATLASGTTIKTIEGVSVLGSGDIQITKTMVDLANVDNTNDASKPVSTATQTALDLKQNAITHLEYNTTDKTLWNNGKGDGFSNTSFGVSALSSNTTTNNNTAYGFYALYSNTTAVNNTAYGSLALSENIAGNNNVANGYNSGRFIADGTTLNTNTFASIFIGVNTKAQTDNQTNQVVIGHDVTGNGSNTVTIGNSSITNNYFTGNVRGGAFIKTGATGTNFLRADGSDVPITAPAWGAITGTLSAQTDLQNALNAKQNAVPHLEFNTTDVTIWNNGKGDVATNTSFGESALISNTAGYANTATGVNALKANQEGYGNTANGTNALQSNTSGISNTAIGYNTLSLSTSGNDNTATGNFALQSNTTGSYNSAYGIFSLNKNTTGGYNTATGINALRKNISGDGNTANGSGALLENTVGVQNTATGGNALQDNTFGNYNTASGQGSLSVNTTGSYNTANGYESGTYIADGETENTTPNNSVFLGANTKAQADNQSNQVVIGHNVIGNGSNTVTIGNSLTTNNYFNGNVRGGAFIKSGGTSAQYLMADGSTTTTASPSYGYVTGTGSQNILNLSGTELTSSYWNGSATVSGSISYSSGRFTVSVAGFYQISANVSFTNNGTGSRSIAIGRNNTGALIGYATQNANASDRTGMSCSGGTFLNAGDYVSVNVYQSSGGGLIMDGAVNGYFSIVKIGN